MKKIRILIASDHPISRAGLQRILAAESTADVVGTCALSEAEQKVNDETPDVILVHVAQITEGSVRIVTNLAESKKSRVGLVMNTSPHEGVLASLLRAGVMGFVVTRSHPADLLRAAEEAARGRRHIDPILNARTLDILLCKQSNLSQRERVVLHGLALGYTNREISVRLGVSTKTVETYRRRLMEKLNLRSRPEIVQFALTMGILRLDDAEGTDNSAAERS